MESHLPRLPADLKSEIKDEILYDIAVFIAIMLVGKLCSSLWKFRYLFIKFIGLLNFSASSIHYPIFKLCSILISNYMYLLF